MPRRRALPFRGGVSCVVGVVMLLVTTACSTTDRKSEWLPQPRVPWSAVSIFAVEPIRDGYRLLTPGTTRGLFPATLGVTRVALREPEEARHFGPLQLVRDPRNEFLQWNRTLDDQMAISEVFPIASRDLGGDQPHPAQVLAAFRALKARLGLIYAVNELSSDETEMFGTLYDTRKSVPVAVLHVRAQSVHPETGDSEGKDEADPRSCDSRSLVRRDFARLVRSCVRELIIHDQPAPPEAPTGWTPVAPVIPPEWPPRATQP